MTRADQIRDAVLLGVVAVLAVLALWPGGRDEKPSPAQTAGAPAARPATRSGAVGSPEELGRASAPPARAGTPPGPGAAGDAIHPLFPLAVGNSWRYRVSGPPDLVPQETWSLTVVSAPSASDPGLARLGFPGRETEGRVWLEDGAVRLEGLPFVEPREFLGNRPDSVTGPWLTPAGFVGGWSTTYSRRASYRYRDPGGLEREGPAEVLQTDRASVEGEEEVVTPAGAFLARRVRWLGRVSITMAGRPLLDDLTVKPFREDVGWFAPGVGLVKRRVSYPGTGAAIVFDLESWERPGATSR